MLERLCNLRYLKREVIFLLDLLISVFSTVASVGLILPLFNIVTEDLNILLFAACFSAFFSIILILIFGQHKKIIRYFVIEDALKILAIASLKSCFVALVLHLNGSNGFPIYSAVLDFLITTVAMISVRGLMIGLYYYIINNGKTDISNSLIYSTLGSNPDFVNRINKDTSSKYRIKGFLTTNPDKVGHVIHGQRVYYANTSEEKLKSVIKRNSISTVIFTSNKLFKRAQGNLVDFCMRNHISMCMVGEIQEIDEKTGLPQRQIKPIQIEDLLDREEIVVDTESISKEIKGRVVMVTGGAGSIGREISIQVALYGVKQLILFDIAETPLHNIQLEMTRLYPNVDVKFILGDVRSRQRVERIIEKYKPTIIFHAAAYKHVPMIEMNPCEGVMTNVWGTVNLAKRAIEGGVEKFVMVSTDKAVNPTNVMGASKRLAEMCVQSANSQNKTEFITTRFGNVLGSNGSVIPLFKEQIALGGPVTVTHPEIIRYFMSIPEACRLVLQAATMGHAGEILVFDMGSPEKIVDLARKMIKLSGFEPDVDIKIKYTGLRPGEKLYEELFSTGEEAKTTHKKINIAKCRSVDIESVNSGVRRLAISARNMDIEQTVRIMKELVPEFKSKNSEFERFD